MERNLEKRKEKSTGKRKGFILKESSKNRKSKLNHNEQKPEDRGREKTRKGMPYKRKP